MDLPGIDTDRQHGRTRRGLCRDDLVGLVDSGTGTISSSIFTDPSIYELELAHIFRKTWQLVGHESQVPKPGDFITGSLGADNVLIQRQLGGEIVVMLNQCRHRGALICRADQGNARSWRCPYHGWVYDAAGNLVGVPREEEGYLNALNKAEWGLIRVPGVELYHGFIFANWDPDAESLASYLGESTFYLDHYFDLSDAGVEVVSSSHWIVPSNWKLQADQHVWDNYHAPISHSSWVATSLIPEGEPTPSLAALLDAPMPGVLWSEPTRGHGGIAGLRGYGAGGPILGDDMDGPPLPLDKYAPPILNEYMAELRRRGAARVGEFRARRMGIAVMFLFPNFGINEVRYLRTWSPRGPNHTEVRNYVFVEKDAPQEIKDAFAKYTNRYFANSGIVEQDDVSNIGGCQSGLSGDVARDTRLNLQMGLGAHVTTAFDNEAPMLVSATSFSEAGARNFYQRWLDLLVEGVSKS